MLSSVTGCVFIIYLLIYFNFHHFTYQFKHTAGFGVDVAKCPIRKPLQPRPVTLIGENTGQECMNLEGIYTQQIQRL